ncbi:AGAP004018-PA-like protein [Anopheles sinensis]|uniref:AGAP004018-PA-like protein n=1 Tax=Anopheles sinensis TaxID=74873 RepID=A0A084VW32_ANOSI|nr:AGAP004018-PA-like protein [Anopheles sinensis]
MVDYCNTRPTSSTLAAAAPAMPSFRSAKARNHREKSTHHHHKSLGEGGDGGQQARVRTVRLVRPQSHGHRNPPNGTNFGFSIRGGLEYGTGFFISAIERDSEADRQGLKVGDQIIRVNGYQVEDAVHRELAQFIANQERLIMKVRGLGIVPIKERTADPLTWHVVSFGATRDKKDTLLLLEDGVGCGRDLKVILSVAPRTKLGCGICKGPDWKPGIFVQFTKEGGVAREAGLRPGDQILSCNGHSFAEVSFGEAVGIMKSSHVLELVVRPSAGLDLFPGESSGYNSSASSVNGDQSPCWGDQTSKRLSIVREESISHDRRRTAAVSVGELNRAASEKTTSAPPPAPPPQPQQQKEPPQTPQQQPKVSGSTTTGQHRKKNTTIIEFSERGTIVNPEAKQSETKTIIVEVHRSASTGSVGGVATGGNAAGAPPVADGLHGSIIPPPPPLFADSFPTVASPGGPPSPAATSQPQSSSEPTSIGSSISAANSLSSAISDELRRRAQKKTAPQGADGLASAATGPAAALTELENRLKEKGTRLRPVTMAISDERHTALMDEFRAVHKRMFKNGFDNAELKKQPPKVTSGEQSNNQPAQEGTTRKSPKGTMGRVAASEMAKASGDSAELESIESFKLTNPQPPPARPPSYYFCPQATGPPTMKKSQKPIAVTISEYAHSAARQDETKKGTRFDFAQLRSVTEAIVGGGGSVPVRDVPAARQVRP